MKTIIIVLITVTIAVYAACPAYSQDAAESSRPDNFSTVVALEGRVREIKEKMHFPGDSVFKDESLPATPIVLTIDGDKGTRPTITVFCLGKALQERCQNLKVGDSLTVVGHVTSGMLLIHRVLELSEFHKVAIVVDRFAKRKWINR